MFNIEIFSLRVSELRKTNNLNQPQLGKAIGMSKQNICRIEKAERAASIEVICALADYFDVSVDYLVGRTDNPKVNM